MTFYMRKNLESFGNNISIDVIKSQVCNAKQFCYIAPVPLNEVGKVNVVCEGFVISETHDAYCFILNLIFTICLGRGKEVYVIFSDKFMTNSILGSLGMNDAHICYVHLHLKLNLEKSLFFNVN